MNAIKKESRQQEGRIKELEHRVTSLNEDNERTQEKANKFSAEKQQLMSEIEEERSENILLRKELNAAREVNMILTILSFHVSY